MSDGSSFIIALDGMAKPIPWELLTVAVVIPTTWSLESRSGPPEFPGLIGAELDRTRHRAVPRHSVLDCPPECADYPPVIDPERPYGLPMA
jgi:hypothetical protein